MSMMRRSLFPTPDLRIWLVALAVSFVGAGCGGAAAAPGLNPNPTPSANRNGVPASRVAVIVMENKEAPAVLSNNAPYLLSLAAVYGLAARSYAVRHPSLPNYIALTSGRTYGITDDCTDCPVDGPNIVDQLDAAKVSWRAYLESMPRPCFKGAVAGLYAKKHNPFMYYRDVAGNPRRCSHVVPLTELKSDLNANRLPTYTWISPNLCSDTHDCPIDRGDRWLSRNVPPLLNALGPEGYLIITYDEGYSNASCCRGSRGGRIATVVAGPDVRRGARMYRPIDQYGVLGSIEESLRLRPLGAAADPRHGRLTPLFKKPPRLR